jgi:hypothetical protein
MSTRTLLRSTVLSFLLAGAVVIVTAAPPPVGAPAASPSAIALNVPTTVTITSTIADPAVISTGVNLLRLNDDGTATIMGQLNDSGTNGDSVAGDHIYTIQLSLQAQVATQFRFVVSAAFRGQLMRSLSTVAIVNATGQFTLFPNMNDPLMLEVRDASGNAIDYFVTKDANGMMTALTSIAVTTNTGNTSRFFVDNQGRPTTIVAPNGATFQLGWQSSSHVSVIASSPNGSVNAHVLVDLSTGTSVTAQLGDRGASELGSALNRPLISSAGTSGSSTSKVTVTQCDGSKATGVPVTMNVSSIGDIPPDGEFQPGVYTFSIPTPDPNAGANITSKCQSLFGPDTINTLCKGLGNPSKSGASGAVAICTTLAGALAAVGQVPEGLAVLVGCADFGTAVAIDCAASQALSEGVCPTIGAIVRGLQSGMVTLDPRADLGSNGIVVAAPQSAPAAGPLFPDFTIIAPSNTAITSFTAVPAFPIANQGFVATAQVACAPASSTLSLGVAGSDGYFANNSCVIGGANASCSLAVPGQAGGTTDSLGALINQSSSTLVVTVGPGNGNLAFSKAGNGNGTVTSIPPGINCGPTCLTQTAPFNGTVQLTAVPAPGSTFTIWGGSCSGTALTTAVVVTANANINCTAAFDLTGLTVTKVGNGSGTVTSSPAGINCGPTCPSQNAPFNGPVQLTAAAASGSAFTGWGGDCTGTALVTTVNVTASNNCTATFDGPTLTVTKSGTGSGTVTSSPAGINCGAACPTQTAPFSGSVQLTAAAASGSSFTGWSGDCSGTALATTVTVNADKTCIATFSGALPAVRLNPFGNQTVNGPYNVEVVDTQQTLTPAPADITITLLRDVISQCSGLLFSSNRTVVVSQGQSSASYNFNAGHDPACNTLPITTRYTVTRAVLGASTILDLSGVPAQQLVLSVTR